MKASEWISVKDRLPELCCDAPCLKYSEEVLLCVDEDRVLTARLVCDKSDNTMFWSISTGGTFDLEEPTHWQEIVFPKKKKSNERI